MPRRVARLSLAPASVAPIAMQRARRSPTSPERRAETLDGDARRQVSASIPSRASGMQIHARFGEWNDRTRAARCPPNGRSDTPTHADCATTTDDRRTDDANGTTIDGARPDLDWTSLLLQTTSPAAFGFLGGTVAIPASPRDAFDPWTDSSPSAEPSPSPGPRAHLSDRSAEQPIGMAHIAWHGEFPTETSQHPLHELEHLVVRGRGIARTRAMKNLGRPEVSGSLPGRHIRWSPSRQATGQCVALPGIPAEQRAPKMTPSGFQIDFRTSPPRSLMMEHG